VIVGAHDLASPSDALRILLCALRFGSRKLFNSMRARNSRDRTVFTGRRRLATKDRAEDLAQETFLAVIRAAVRYEPRAMVKTYLYGIALKLLAAERRKLSGNEPQIDDDHDPAEDSPSDNELWVRQALEKLDSSEREILMLREYEQLNYAEIGELLLLPVNTVRSRLFRSRMALKSFLEPKRKAQSRMRSASDGEAKS
jgi:RNA polymerase sigma-70 factor (ECF subfamily)